MGTITIIIVCTFIIAIYVYLAIRFINLSKFMEESNAFIEESRKLNNTLNSDASRKEKKEALNRLEYITKEFKSRHG